MQINFSKKVAERFLEKYDLEWLRDKMGYNYRGEVEDVQLSLFDNEQLDLLESLINEEAGGKGKGLNKLSLYRRLRHNPAGSKVSSLEGLAEALKLYIAENCPHKWLFVSGEDDELLPYYVTEVTYDPGDSDNPASTTLHMAAMERGEREGKSHIWYHTDIAGKTAPELLNASELLTENEEMVAVYQQQVERYKQVAPQTGFQFEATGYAFEKGSWRDSLLAMEREGRPTKVVMDDLVNEDGEKRGNNSSTVSSAFWATSGVLVRRGRSRSSYRTENPDENIPVQLPIHPYVLVFDLDKHQYVTIHVNNLTEYEYDPNVIRKLVLPEETKDLIEILIRGANTSINDIIRGKTGGVIVIATGDPGTGKTLTAEVMSERMQRPLYVVQCSQLGTDEETLEKRLRKVLNRASRWKALLLIDEADVYVHERGRDIQQNAIVGVFLRVLEYYRGVLFMTSNRATVIDDAIMSRATAWVKYEKPKNEEDLTRVWLILADQYGVKMSDEVVESVLEQFPVGTIAPRSVRNILKLAKLMADNKGVEVDEHLIGYVAQFLDIAGGRRSGDINQKEAE